MMVFPSFYFQQWTLVACVEWELAPTTQGSGCLNQHLKGLAHTYGYVVDI